MKSYWGILANLIVVTVVTVIAVVSPNIAAPHIRGAIKLSADDMRWVSIGYIMTLGLILPLGIFLAEKYGYKRVFFWGIVIFAIGLLIGAFNWNFLSTMAGRMISGLGAGVILPLTNAIIVQEMPKEKEAIALAIYIGIGFGVGTGIAFLFGGWCTQVFGWPYVFIFPALSCLPLLITTEILHHETPPKKEVPFDFPGYFCFIVFILSLLLVVNNGKAEWNTDGWTSNFILFFEGLTALSLIALLIVELRVKNPLIPFRLFKKQSFFLGTISVMFTATIVYINFLICPTLTVNLLEYEPYMAGRELASLGLSAGCASILVVLLKPFLGIRWLTLIGMALLGLGSVLSSSVTLFSSHEQFQLALNLRGLGMIFALGPAMALAMSEIPKELAGSASILLILLRQIAGTVGTATAEAVSIQRGVFHAEMFGTQTSVVSPKFLEVQRGLEAHLMRNGGAGALEAKSQSYALLRKNIISQADYTAINDAYWIFGVIILVITGALLLELLWSLWKKSNEVSI